MSRNPDRALAWSLSEGDLLPGGEMVLSVQRDAYAGRVWVTSDNGTRRELGRGDRVVVAHRAFDDAVTRPGWRRTALVIGTVRRMLGASSQL